MWRARAAGELLGILFVVWRRTLRTEIRGLDRLEANAPAVLAAWHGRMQGPIFSVAHRGVLTMASLSPDGEIAARAVARLGLVPARGSTGRGGAAAYEQIRGWFEAGIGRYIGLTVDGPRGPARRPKRGALEMARQLDLPLIPTSFSSRPYWRLRSWDRMLIAPPLSRMVVEFGEPLRVGGPLSPAEERAELTRRIDEITARLDHELHGRPLWEDSP